MIATYHYLKTEKNTLWKEEYFMSNKISNFAKLIMEICSEEKIKVTPISDYWAFLLEKDGKHQTIYGYQFSNNQAVNHSLCSDKSAASEILTYFGVPNVPHICCMSPQKPEYMSPSGNWSTVSDMLDTYGELVLKDNQGTCGELVFHVKNIREAEHATQLIFSKASSMAVSPYFEIENEYRIILMQNEIKLIYEKIRPHIVGDGTSTIASLIAKWQEENANSSISSSSSKAEWSRILKEGEIYPLSWKHNLCQGACAKQITDTKLCEELSSLAKEAATALGISFASVDIIKTSLGYQILEVNSGVMMEYLAGEKPEYRAIAKDIYRQAILTGFSKK